MAEIELSALTRQCLDHHNPDQGTLDTKTQVIQEYVEGRVSFVNMLAPAQLNETILFDAQTFILDVHPPDMRKNVKGLPNVYEVNPLHVVRYLKQLPRDKQIMAYCPGGGLSVMISYYLKAKGFKRITNLEIGLMHGASDAKACTRNMLVRM